MINQILEMVLTLFQLEIFHQLPIVEKKKPRKNNHQGNKKYHRNSVIFNREQTSEETSANQFKNKIFIQNSLDKERGNIRIKRKSYRY